MSAALFTEFVDVVFDGNRTKAAEALEVDKSTVSRVCSGDRGVTPDMARRCEELSNGRFPRERFIWPEATDKTPVMQSGGK